MTEKLTINKWHLQRVNKLDELLVYERYLKETLIDTQKRIKKLSDILE